MELGRFALGQQNTFPTLFTHHPKHDPPPIPFQSRSTSRLHIHEHAARRRMGATRDRGGGQITVG